MKKAIMSFMIFLLVFSASVAEAASSTYTVKRGDTLWSIARAHKTTVNQLKQWNNLKSNNIAIGKKLIVSKSAVRKAKPAASGKKVVKELSVRSTAYTASCRGCSGITATGINLKKNPKAKVIAVDPKVIPLGTKVYVEGYGEAVAGDKGGAIKGNKIDVFFPTKKQAYRWGVRTVKVKVLK
ncbi:3D domain-containing protein [Bacillus xiapuensis]|uniref:3D domain-containing protein n=1 Tax=Bacillus xiapuensis TaxID=2014075 RepID=UPI000C248499|nr:3D domain-containing protein [Bacillus xiapuensis]